MSALYDMLAAMMRQPSRPRVGLPEMFRPESIMPAEQPMGGLVPGNIDLARQPSVPNPRGGRSTVYSFSVNFGGKEYLLPMVTPDGRLLNEEQAIDEFRRTGRHLGVFDSPDAATAAADRIHKDYEAGRYDTRKFGP